MNTKRCGSVRESMAYFLSNVRKICNYVAHVRVKIDSIAWNNNMKVCEWCSFTICRRFQCILSTNLEGSCWLVARVVKIKTLTPMRCVAPSVSERDPRHLNQDNV